MIANSWAPIHCKDVFIYSTTVKVKHCDVDGSLFLRPLHIWVQFKRRQDVIDLFFLDLENQVVAHNG